LKKQLTLAASDFERYRKPTRREKFLSEMQSVVPWKELCAVVEPYYPKTTRAGGRPPVGLERMLRIHCLQLWFDLSDPAVEEALYDSLAMRSFVGIDLGREPVPDETTVMRFRHLLEKHKLGERIFEEVGRVLLKRGLRLSKGTIVDATIIAAPSSTKNAEGERDPEMHQAKKGNQWHFGMKVHAGTDPNGIVHSLSVTDAACSDINQLPHLIHGAEDVLYGDKAYWCEGDRDDLEAVGIRYRITRRAKRGTPLTERQEAANRGRSKIRAAVEHPFGVVKHLWGHRKVRYRGLAKNAGHFYTAFALANLYRMRRRLAAQGA
jgi:transposase, IS5 family